MGRPHREIRWGLVGCRLCGDVLGVEKTDEQIGRVIGGLGCMALHVYLRCHR